MRSRRAWPKQMLPAAVRKNRRAAGGLVRTGYRARLAARRSVAGIFTLNHVVLLSLHSLCDLHTCRCRVSGPCSRQSLSTNAGRQVQQFAVGPGWAKNGCAVVQAACSVQQAMHYRTSEGTA